MNFADEDVVFGVQGDLGVKPNLHTAVSKILQFATKTVDNPVAPVECPVRMDRSIGANSS